MKVDVPIDSAWWVDGHGHIELSFLSSWHQLQSPFWQFWWNIASLFLSLNFLKFVTWAGEWNKLHKSQRNHGHGTFLGSNVNPVLQSAWPGAFPLVSICICWFSRSHIPHFLFLVIKGVYNDDVETQSKRAEILLESRFSSKRMALTITFLYDAHICSSRRSRKFLMVQSVPLWLID